MALFKRDRFLLEHEGECDGNRFRDKARGDGKTVVYEHFVQGDGQKVELLAPSAEAWRRFWDAFDGLAAAAEGGDLGQGGAFHLRGRHDGQPHELRERSDEALEALTALLGRPLASARAALKPPRLEEGAEEEYEEEHEDEASGPEGDAPAQ